MSRLDLREDFDYPDNKKFARQFLVEISIVLALAFAAATMAMYYVFYLYDWFNTNILLNGN
jgi:hypothetical protein